MSQFPVRPAGLHGLAYARIIPGEVPPQTIGHSKENKGMRLTRIPLLTMIMLSAMPMLAASGQQNPFVGSWPLTARGGYAGWFGVEERDGKLPESMMWTGGSVVPVSDEKREGNELVLTRHSQSSVE